MRFHATREEAERAGFRPCKRCKPDVRDVSRQRTATTEMQFGIGKSSLGALIVARSDKGLTAVLFGADRRALERDLQSRFPAATLIEDNASLAAIIVRVVRFVDAPARGVDVPLDLRGTPFQRAVWEALRQIPTGSTMSYSALARQVGRPKAVRAVAQACAANALAVVVPCHRAVRSDGMLSGYRWGVARKRLLLEKESAS